MNESPVKEVTDRSVGPEQPRGSGDLHGGWDATDRIRYPSAVADIRRIRGRRHNGRRLINFKQTTTMTMTS